MRPRNPRGLSAALPPLVLAPALLAAADPQGVETRAQDPSTPTGPAAQDPEAPPVEFGRVRWGRRLEPALEASRGTGRPVLLLFQEVPG